MLASLTDSTKQRVGPHPTVGQEGQTDQLGRAGRRGGSVPAPLPLVVARSPYRWRRLGQLRRRLGAGQVDRRHDAIETIPTRDRVDSHQGVDDPGRIGQSGGFDHDSIEPRLFPDLVAPARIPERLDQVAAEGSAQAATAHLDQVVVGDPTHQEMIEPDPAELVDDDSGAGEGRLADQLIEHRGLAAAQRAGQQGQRRQFRRVTMR